MSSPDRPLRTSRLVLVDDHPVVISGYRMMLQAHPEYEICGTATTESEALDVVELSPITGDVWIREV